MSWQFLNWKKRQGNFQIAPWMAACKVSQTNWAAKSEEEKDKLFQKILEGVPKKEKKLNGQIGNPHNTKSCKKPGTTQTDKICTNSLK